MGYIGLSAIITKVTDWILGGLNSFVNSLVSKEYQDIIDVVTCFFWRICMKTNMKNRFFIDATMTTVILVAMLLSYLLESYRIIVFIFGVLYCLAFVAQFLYTIVQLNKALFPFGILFTICMSTFLQNNGVNWAYIIVWNRNAALLGVPAILIITLILFMVLVHNSNEKITIKEYFSQGLVSFMLSIGIVLYGLFPMINYSFDTTETKNVDVMITECIGNDHLRGAFFDRHNLYRIKTQDDVLIEEISIDTDYDYVDINDKVSIKYRKGVFAVIYKVNYSTLSKNELEISSE